MSGRDAAEQLLDFAEYTYGHVFPPGGVTHDYGPIRFRAYPGDRYLGVAVDVPQGSPWIERGVYYLDAQSSSTPSYQALLTAFITPVSAQLPAAPALAANFTASLPIVPRGSGQPCADRVAWSAAPAKVAAITAQADALLPLAFPAWNSAEYLAWSNSGSLVGETMMANRKAWLYPLVLAECAAWQGKYVERIRSVMQALATQPTWIGPQQDASLVALNQGTWFLDLMSAAMAHELAQALYLLGDRIDLQTRQVVMSALEARVFAPVRRTLSDNMYGWWLTTPINWNAVILAGVTGAALAVLPSRYDRALFASMGQHYIQNFVNAFPDSGYAFEGPGYWTYGVKHFAVLRHRLFESSLGAVDLLKAPKPRAFSLYGSRMEMTPQGTVAPIGDTHIGVRIDPQTRNFLAAAYGATASWPGNTVVRVDPWHMNDMPLVEASLLLTSSVPLAAGWELGETTAPGLRSYFADVGVLVTRSPLSEGTALAATIKSAGNNGNHEHDDVGSYSIALDGATPAGEVGIGNYTARTFSSQRRTVLWINSYGHPVPVVGGRQQVDAAGAANTVTATSFTEEADQITIDMAPAYALPAGWQLTRRLTNDRVARSITVEDQFAAFGTPQSFEVALTTAGSWSLVAPNVVRLQMWSAKVDAIIEASGAYTVTGESVTDDGLTFQRVAVRLNAPATAGWVRATFVR